MADLKVELVRLSAVTPHPDPETTALEIASIEGMEYRVVIRKGQFKTGSVAIYFPIDSCIPQHWVEAFGIEKYYHRSLRAARLRGVFSEGLLIDPIIVVNDPMYSDANIVDDDYTQFFGVTRAEPVLAVHMDGECEGSIPGHLRFPEPQHWKKYSRLLEDGEPVVITEKIHGTNAQLYRDSDGEFHFGSHSLWWKDVPSNATNIYIRAWKEHFPKFEKMPCDSSVFAEIYGLQDLKYGYKNGHVGLLVFAIRGHGKFADYPEFSQMCKFAELATVPQLYIGPYSAEIVKQFNNADSLAFPGQMMEGVVVQPVVERATLETGRLVLKYLSERYLLRKKGTEQK